LLTIPLLTGFPTSPTIAVESDWPYGNGQFQDQSLDLSRSETFHPNAFVSQDVQIPVDDSSVWPESPKDLLSSFQPNSLYQPPDIDFPNSSAKPTVTSHAMRTAANNRTKREARYQCQYCSDILTTSAGLHNHINSHFGNKNFPCTTCGKAFATKWDRKRHEKNLHSSPPAVNQNHYYILPPPAAVLAAHISDLGTKPTILVFNPHLRPHPRLTIPTVIAESNECAC
jgi:hypothetical protein